MELGPLVILSLKILVATVTVLLLASLVALWKGKYKLHGKINVVFFTLTLVTLFGFELIIRLIRPDVFDYIQQNEALRRALSIHLCFAVPSAVLMPAMLFTGLKHFRRLHIAVACVFGILWAGTFVTGLLL